MRLDAALVQAQLIATRTKAKAAIESGLIFYDGKPVTKPALDVQDLAKLEIRGELMPYVSRGGLKLEKALKEFNLTVKDKIVLDIGSSTGGFTDCALQNGARQVIAIDVGQNQLCPTLRQNKAVLLYEGEDFRHIATDKIANAEVAVSDVSFISITKMIPKLKELNALKELICLIKPQFECGKEVADKYKGVIKNKKVHLEVLSCVLAEFEAAGFLLQNLTFSPIQGSSGNIEYLAHFKPSSKSISPDLNALIEQAFRHAI